MHTIHAMELLIHFWPHLVGALILVSSIIAIGHVVLYKRDPRAAVGWIGIILVFPLGGAII